MAPKPQRDAWLQQSDDELLSGCEIDTYRASGPGGQKRNKTSSAVRLRHNPSGISVIAEESRSQHENKAKALRRLRLAIAFHVRMPMDEGARRALERFRTSSGRMEVSLRNREYPLVVAYLLDALESQQGRLRETASALGLTTGQLSRIIVRDGKLLSAANSIRHACGLSAISG